MGPAQGGLRGAGWTVSGTEGHPLRDKLYQMGLRSNLTLKHKVPPFLPSGGGEDERCPFLRRAHPASSAPRPSWPSPAGSLSVLLCVMGGQRLRVQFLPLQGGS